MAKKAKKKKEKKEKKIKEEKKEVKEKVEKKVRKVPPRISFDKESWKPKTELGKMVKSDEIKDINSILDSGKMIMEAEIVDALLPDLSTDLLLIGQAKGKFGGGQRRVFKQTQKKTKEGNKPHFATMAVVGNKDGIFGIGYGKAKETVPAREKAIRNAKKSIVKIRRGCGSWQCSCKESHSIPFAVSGKCGSVRLKLIPAPKGTGLRVEKECQKILSAAGVKDAWSKSRGQTRSRVNMVKACEQALKMLMDTKLQEKHFKELGVKE
jgi:small subunit ribosomal protein S5